MSPRSPIECVLRVHRCIDGSRCTRRTGKTVYVPNNARLRLDHSPQPSLPGQAEVSRDRRQHRERRAQAADQGGSGERLRRRTAYNLVYGQGRVEAFIALGQTAIPAIVTELSEEGSLIFSLVENVARRQHYPIELLREIGALKNCGYTDLGRRAAGNSLHPSSRDSCAMLDSAPISLTRAVREARRESSPPQAGPPWRC